MPQKYTTHNQY